MTEHDVEEVVRSGRVAPSAAVDQRVLHALRDAAAEYEDLPSTRTRTGVGIAAAVVLAGLGVVFAVDRLGRDDGPAAGEGAGTAMTGDGVDPVPQDPVDRSPMPGSYGIEELLERAPYVLLVEIAEAPATNSPAPSGPSVRVRVRSVLSEIKGREGPSCAVGDALTLQPIPFSGRLGWLPRTVLDRDDPRGGQKGSLWLIALEPERDEQGEFTGAYRNIVGEGLAGLPVASAEIPVGASAMEAIRGLVIEALGERRLRAPALEAVRAWEGMDFKEPGGAFYEDPEAKARLLELAGDPDAHVRWLTAWTLPRNGGDSVRVALRSLAFDPVPMVRQPARLLLRHYGEFSAADMDMVWDYEFEENFERVTPGMVQKLSVMHPGKLEDLLAMSDPTSLLWTLRGMGNVAESMELLIEALGHPEPKPRRAAAAGLANCTALDVERVTTALMPLLEDGDPSVRRMAAAALYRHHDPAGLPALLEGAAADDLSHAVQCVDFLSLFAPARDKRLLDIMAGFTKDERPWVRAFALAGVARCRAVRAVSGRGPRCGRSTGPFVARAGSGRGAGLVGPGSIGVRARHHKMRARSSRWFSRWC